MKVQTGCFLFVVGLFATVVLPGKAVPGQALTNDLVVTDDLYADGCQVLHEQRALVLYVAREGCPYCRALEADVLRPLLAGGRWPAKGLLKQLSVDADIPVQDFDRNLKSSEAIANRLLAGGVTPVLHFLDGYGNPLVRPLVGYNGSDFFPVYLERALSEAIATVPAQSADSTRDSGYCDRVAP